MGTLRRSKQRTDAFLLARPVGSLSNFKESSKRVQREPVRRLFFAIKSALFVQANVSVNTKLTSKVPFFRPAKVPAFRVKVTHSAFVPAVLHA